MQDLRQHHVRVEVAIRRVVHAHLENAPLHLFNTSAGRVLNRDAQIHTSWKAQSTWRSYHHLWRMRPHTEPIDVEMVKGTSAGTCYRIGGKEELLLVHDIQDKVTYDLEFWSSCSHSSKFPVIGMSLGME
ncbi:uncharacterized protein BJ212DRAFT_54595 [Suillus subaureus]|uniref:Uncharacterized protein n=1 Tax=Suillus subaureus TaxID=48587 RepID=A0A9P7EQF1_9AGAM|nr:uncharacterized protein BJ212DRAFT_54595 [Suillus subaureus]KAG1827461.1 hypothetical protein BJ212DRAFT_54595 [Suillus subaureus]